MGRDVEQGAGDVEEGKMIEARILTGALDLRFHADGSISIYDQNGMFRFRVSQTYQIMYTQYREV